MHLLSHCITVSICNITELVVQSVNLVSSTVSLIWCCFCFVLFLLISDILCVLRHWSQDFFLRGTPAGMLFLCIICDFWLKSTRVLRLQLAWWYKSTRPLSAAPYFIIFASLPLIVCQTEDLRSSQNDSWSGTNELQLFKLSPSDQRAKTSAGLITLNWQKNTSHTRENHRSYMYTYSLRMPTEQTR